MLRYSIAMTAFFGAPLSSAPGAGARLSSPWAGSAWAACRPHKAERCGILRGNRARGAQAGGR